MTPDRDLDDEMKRFELDERTADRLLSGQVSPLDAPPGYGLVADAVQKARVSHLPYDAADESATVAAMIDVLRSNDRETPPVRRRTFGAGRFSAKVAAIATVTLLGATAAAAASNNLPAPAQRLISEAASHLGVSIPRPGHNSPTASARPESVPKPAIANSASCAALATDHGAGTSSVAVANLRRAANAAGMSVANFCKRSTASQPHTVAPPGASTSGASPATTPKSRPATSPAHSTGPSTSTPHGNSGHGTGPPTSTPHGNSGHGTGPPATTPHGNSGHGTGPPTSTPHGNSAHGTGPPTSTPGNSHKP